MSTNSLFLGQKILSWLFGIRLPTVCIVSVLCLLLISACTTVPVNDNRASATTRMETQQKIFTQAKALFLNQEYTQAASALLLLARQGHTDAQYTVGYMYHYGYGLPRNKKESIRWITTAAARGHPQAGEALARMNAAYDQRGVVAEPVQIPE